jgi:hypothetical protein
VTGVAVEKGSKKVISGEPAAFPERIINDLRTDFRAILAQGIVFQQPQAFTLTTRSTSAMAILLV